jgi:hypothetical protein
MIRHFQGRINGTSEIHVDTEQLNIIGISPHRFHISLLYNVINEYPSYEELYDDEEDVIIGIFRTRQLELHAIHDIRNDTAELLLKPIGSIYSYAHIMNVPVNCIRAVHQIGEGIIPEYSDAQLYYCCYSDGEFSSDSGYSTSPE